MFELGHVNKMAFVLESMKLFMLLLGGRPKTRNTEQHDIFFGIGHTVKDLVPGVKAFWPEAAANLHIDAWREVNCVDGYTVSVEKLNPGKGIDQRAKRSSNLFFLNLGGYKANELEEFHYKILVVADGPEQAKTQARATAFYKHTGLAAEQPGTHRAEAHIDDKYGVDIDDIHAVQDILPVAVKQQYWLQLQKIETCLADLLHLGYFRLQDL